MGHRWSCITWMFAAVGHRHSAWRIWKWQRSCRAEGHAPLKASFSALELPLTEAAGTCSSHGVHGKAMGFGATLKYLVLHRYSGYRV